MESMQIFSYSVHVAERQKSGRRRNMAYSFSFLRLSLPISLLQIVAPLCQSHVALPGQCVVHGENSSQTMTSLTFG